jgi:citrate synthase
MNKPDPAFQKDYLPAREAIGILDIREQTLYAYVSRGWIRSITQPGRKDRLYFREDVEKMRHRSLARSGHGVVAASAMYWGEPIIPTSITEITPGGPLYRGHNAIQLAREGISYEAAAELLWTGKRPITEPRWRIGAARSAAVCKLAENIRAPEANDQLMETFALFALQLGMSRGGADQPASEAAAFDAARELIQAFTGCFGYISARRRFMPVRSGQPVVEGLIAALGIEDSEENRVALQSILVLFADHELSPSVFAARVTASTGGALHSCVVSAVCANTGLHVGRQYDHIEDFLARASTRPVLARRVQECQERGAAVPGFGHPFYMDGDPRAVFLLELVRRRKTQSKRLEAIYGFIEDAQAALGLHPRHELAVITLAIAMGLPAHGAGALFSLARSAGWIAHVQEQRASGLMLRPRAKFMRGRAPAGQK